MAELQRLFMAMMPSLDANQPVQCHLRNELQSEIQRIEDLRARRQLLAQRTQKTVSADLGRRQQLRKQLETSQKKHEAAREAVLDKIRKAEAFKVKQAQEGNQRFKQSEREKQRERRQKFAQAQADAREYWQKAGQRQQNLWKRQKQCESELAKAASLKKTLERKREEFSSQTLEKMLNKHSGRRQAVRMHVEEKQQLIHSPHHSRISSALTKANCIESTRTESFINGIAGSMERSMKLVAAQRKLQVKSAQKRMGETQYRFSTIRDQYKTLNKDRASSLKNCKCNAIDNADNVEQPHRSASELKFRQTMPLFSPSLSTYKQKSMVETSRSKFRVVSQKMVQKVQNKQQLIDQWRHLKGEKYLVRESQISQALKIKSEIMKESNCLLRHESVLPIA